MIKKIINRVEKFWLNRIAVPIIERKYANSYIDKHKIVVDNFYGHGFGDNPKYIVESLLKKEAGLDIVWLADSLSYNFPNGVRPVLINSLQATKELMTASIWIDNIKNFRKPVKKKDQYYLQTWHAGLGIKASEAQIEERLSNDYVRTDKEDSQKIDLMLSDSNWTTNIYSNYFWYDGEIKKTGFPKNDILINEPECIKARVYSEFAIPTNFKIILYAPTFRDFNNDISVYKHDFRKFQIAAKRRFNNNYVILIRLHPNIAQKFGNDPIFSFNDQIINASFYPDMQELIIASEILITDYSSCMFDGMIANKKVFLLASDYDQFVKKDRKLLFDVSELPFSLSTSDEQLITRIKQFDEKDYIYQLDKFKKDIKLVEPGNASDKVADIIIKQMKTN